MKIVLIGAGSAQFGCGTLGDIFQSNVLSEFEIVLLDINSEALDKVYKLGEDFISKKNLKHKLSATTNRKKALKGADYIIISIEVGDRFELWNQDWKTPLQFGIKQVYGENGGPGGIFHSLRIIPPILEICDDVMEICPNAYVFNYSNPMTAITTTVLRKHPELNFIGLCHEIASLERYLPTILNTDFDNLELRSGGLNHFSVLLEAKYKDSGKDAYPDIIKRASSFFEKEPGFTEIWQYVKEVGNIPHTEGATERWLEEYGGEIRSWSDRYLFKVIFETYKLLPITVDSHLGEYISWAQDAADHRGILDFFDFYKYALTQPKKTKISMKLHERVVPIIEGIISDLNYEESAVNILNNGAIKGLPDNIAVEVPAIVNKNGLTAVELKNYPVGFCALLRNYAGVYDITAEAILNCSKNLVLQALLACPVVDKFHGMEELVDTMISQQSKWLGYLK